MICVRRKELWVSDWKWTHNIPQTGQDWSMMIYYISTSLYLYLPLYIHSNSIRQQPSNCGYKPNTADISLTSPLYFLCFFNKIFWFVHRFASISFSLFSRQWRNRFGWIWNQVRLLHVQEIIRGIGTSFRRNDFWDGFCGQALVMIGYWLPWLPSTYHN